MLLCKASNHFLHTSNVLYNLVNALIMLSSDSIIVRTEKKKQEEKHFRERKRERTKKTEIECTCACSYRARMMANFERIFFIMHKVSRLPSGVSLHSQCASVHQITYGIVVVVVVDSIRFFCRTQTHAHTKSETFCHWKHIKID